MNNTQHNLKSIFALCVVLTCALSAQAAKKSTKNQKVDSVEAAAEKSIKEAQKDLRTTGPADLSMPVTEKKIDFSAAADKKRDESIAEIQAILGKVRGAQKGELVFRLAELYWEKSKFIARQEFDAYDAAHQKWFDGGEKGKEPQLKSYTSQSVAYKTQALTNYQYVIDKYPEYPRLDEVLFIMAQNEYEAGNKKIATQHYSKLIRKFPKSIYVGDAYLALGEHYFGANNLAKATTAYGFAYKVGKARNKPSTYRYAQYKLAWCDYNKQEFDKALKKFKEVVSDSEAAAKRGGSGDSIQLKREALNDMVLTFAQVGEVKSAYDYFVAKAGKDEGYRLTSKMAAVYHKQGDFVHQIETLKHVLSIDPYHPSAPDYQSQIVASYSKLDERDEVRKEVRVMVDRYSPNSEWAKRNAADKDTVERATTIAENRMRNLVTEYHEAAQKHDLVSDYELARDLYGDYLKAFPNSDQAYTLAYYYAEILWDLGEWEKSAGQYDAVVARDPKGKYTRDSAYNAILAWEKIVAGEKPPVRSKSGKLIRSKRGRKSGKVKKKVVKMEQVQKNKEYKPEPIPKAELALANACDAYVRVVPESVSRGNKKLTNELVVVKFKAGYTFHKYYHFDEAAKRFGELIERFPNTQYARRGADSILDSYDARSRWADLEKWSRIFSKKKKLMSDKKFAEKVNRFLMGAAYNVATSEFDSATKTHGDLAQPPSDEARTQYVAVVDRYNAYLKEFPKSEFAPKAQYNVILAQHRLGELDQALRSTEMMLKKYDKQLDEGELAQINVREDLDLKVVQYHSKMAHYKEAAETSSAFVDKYPNNKNTADILYNSAVFYDGLGEKEKSKAAFNKYMTKYPKRDDVDDVYLRLARGEELDGNHKAAGDLYGQFGKKYGAKATADQKLLAQYKAIKMKYISGDEKGARRDCLTFLGNNKSDTLKKSDIGKEAGGFCAFQTLHDRYQAYKAIKIVGKNLKKPLDDKKKQRDQLAKDYLDVLNYGNGEWGIAGLYMAADALLEYVDALRSAPDPVALRDNYEALDMFRAELDNIAFPVEDQAIGALEAPLDKAFELGIYSDYTIKIQDTLKTFKPGAFGQAYALPFYASATDKIEVKK